jgi:hypothetical protein
MACPAAAAIAWPGLLRWRWRTLAFVLTDIEGSTALLDHLGVLPI